MRIDVVTIFPSLFDPFRSTALLGAACERGLVDLRVHDLRDWTRDRHRTVDDAPYGGGPGMVMKPEPLVEAIEALAGAKGDQRTARVLLLSPQGRRFDQALAGEFAAAPHLVLVCGRYEGVDARAIELAVDEEISIGDYVLSGGELPAMVLIEAISREIPGVVQLPDSVARDSFRSGLLDYPHYTRPPEVEGLKVPEVLLSGDHAAIERWRLRSALVATLAKRPDLLESADLDPVARRELDRIRAGEGPGGVAGSRGS